MGRYKNWTENNMKNHAMSKDKLWTTIRKHIAQDH